MVSEAIFPTNRGYICIEKWSQIFVSGIGSVHSESEEKSLFKLKISKKIHRDTFFLSQSMLLPLVFAPYWRFFMERLQPQICNRCLFVCDVFLSMNIVASNIVELFIVFSCF